MKDLVLHIDGDAFFASVELASRPDLRGKPVVTGYERGIATALSYEAKKLGVTRGMPVFQIKKLFPEVTILPSNYDDYLLYCKRLQNIVRDFVEDLEPYSIDECFARIDANNPLEFGKEIKKEVMTKLGITVSLGIASTKVLAKIASKREKPNGLTWINESNQEEVLRTTKIGSLWGIGRSHNNALRAEKIETALDLSRKSREWIYMNCHKSLREIWHEIRGERVFEISEDKEDVFKSIARSRTFHPFSNNREYLYAELARHLEEASSKARSFRVMPRRIHLALKTTDFYYLRDEIELGEPSPFPALILPSLRKCFDKLFRPDLNYRACGLTLSSLIPYEAGSESLFSYEIFPHNTNFANNLVLSQTLDRINRRFGENTIHLGSTLILNKKTTSISSKPLCIPYLGKTI